MGADLEGKNGGERKGSDRYNPPLSINQRVWFLFLLPTAFCCVIYIADIATDIALIERHFSEERCLVGTLTLILLYLPSTVNFVLTVMNPTRRPEPDVKTSKKVCWILKEFGLVILFPIHAIHRFAGKLFWSLEALLCSDLEKEEALLEASKPSPAELYLLLQAFFQAAPQALLQTYTLASFKIPHERTGVIQLLGITTSIASAAIAASLYMRFESQRLAGRRTPWSTKSQNSEKAGLKSKMSLMTTIESQITADTIADNSPAAEEPAEEEKKAESPKQPQLPKGVPQSAILSLPPLPPQIRARLIRASGDELPEDLQKDYDSGMDGEPLNIRSSIYGPDAKSPNRDRDPIAEELTRHSLEPPSSLSPAPSLPEVPPPPLPYPLDIPADDDGSERDLNDSRAEDESLMDQATVEESKMQTASPSAEHSPTIEKPVEEHMSRERLIDDTSKPTSPKHFQPIPLPTRKWKVEGLVEDDFLGKFIGFIWWFLFITSRVLALATLAFFYPWAFAAVFLLHYFGMVAYLFNCEKSKDSSVTLLRLGLGFVYLFCFVEIRTKFKNPNMFTLIFVVVGIVENMFSSAAWYFLADWSSWWFLYAFFFIVTSMILSIMSMGLYFLILKPPTQDIYTN